MSAEAAVFDGERRLRAYPAVATADEDLGHIAADLEPGLTGIAVTPEFISIKTKVDV